MSYTVSLEDALGRPKIVVVGCGGTGGFVVEGLCRLLANSELYLLLIDHDRVDRELLNEATGIGMRQLKGVVIGCVDNADARLSIARGLQWGDWWLDAGNGHQSGQVLLGNTTSVDGLEESFDEDAQTVDKLPAPSLQLPALLHPPTKPVTRDLDCAEEVEAEGQSPTINQMMASLVLEFMYRLLKGTLTWMGAYVDLEAGTLSTVPAEPMTVAKMFGVKVGTLMAMPACSRGMYMGRRR